MDDFKCCNALHLDTYHIRRETILSWTMQTLFFNCGCDCQEIFHTATLIDIWWYSAVISLPFVVQEFQLQLTTKTHTRAHTCTLVNESLSSGEYSLSALSRSTSLRGVRGRGFITSRFYRPPTQRLSCITPSILLSFFLWFLSLTDWGCTFALYSVKVGDYSPVTLSHAS